MRAIWKVTISCFVIFFLGSGDVYSYQKVYYLTVKVQNNERIPEVNLYNNRELSGDSTLVVNSHGVFKNGIKICSINNGEVIDLRTSKNNRVLSYCLLDGVKVTNSSSLEVYFEKIYHLKDDVYSLVNKNKALFFKLSNKYISSLRLAAESKFMNSLGDTLSIFKQIKECLMENYKQCNQVSKNTIDLDIKYSSTLTRIMLKPDHNLTKQKIITGCLNFEYNFVHEYDFFQEGADEKSLERFFKVENEGIVCTVTVYRRKKDRYKMSFNFETTSS